MVNDNEQVLWVVCMRINDGRGFVNGNTCKRNNNTNNNNY